MKAKKASLSAEDKQREADMVLRSIEKMPCFQKAQSVLMYYSLPDELPTHNFVQKWAAEKKVYLPRVVGDELEIAIYGELVTDGKYGIEEPTAASVSPDEIDSLPWRSMRKEIALAEAKVITTACCPSAHRLIR